MDNPSQTDTNVKRKKPERRFSWQFSLRTLLIVVSLICIALGLYIGPKTRRHNQVLAIEAVKGIVIYRPHEEESWMVEQLRNYLPQDWFDEITSVFLQETDADDTTLEEIKSLVRLDYLDLRRTRVTDAGLVHLKGLVGLESLILVDTRITDMGMENLSGLSDLKRLFLDKTGITDTGLDKLKGLTKLEYLSLNFTYITDNGLEKLNGLTDLEYLLLEGTRVSEAGATALLKALPDCQIYF